MAKNQGKTGFVVHPAGRNSRCGFQEAHVETQLAHTNRLDVHKCIPELRKIGYQRRGKYDFLPADTLCQKKASPNTHFIIQRLCHVGGKSLPTFFVLFFFLNSLAGGQPDFSDCSSVGLTKHKGSQSEARRPSGRRCRWTSHSVLFSYFSLWSNHSWRLDAAKHVGTGALQHEIVKAVISAGFS